MSEEVHIVTQIKDPQREQECFCTAEKKNPWVLLK